jgi:hypothetical protein
MKGKDTRRTQRLWDGNTPALTPASDLPSRYTDTNEQVKQLTQLSNRLLKRVLYLEKQLRNHRAKALAKYLSKQLTPKEESKSTAYRLKAGPR